MSPERYQGKSVCILGKRNSGFEVAQGLLPWARRLVLASPRPVDTAVLAFSPLRLRYLQPFDEYVRGGSGSHVVDASIERVERHNGGYRIRAHGTTMAGRARARGGRGDRRNRVPGAAPRPPEHRRRHGPRRAAPGPDAVLGERVGAGHLLRRQRDAGLARPREARRDDQLELGPRVPLQRAPPRAAHRRDGVRTSAGSGARSIETRSFPSSRASSHARRSSGARRRTSHESSLSIARAGSATRASSRSRISSTRTTATRARSRSSTTPAVRSSPRSTSGTAAALPSTSCRRTLCTRSTGTTTAPSCAPASTRSSRR